MSGGSNKPSFPLPINRPQKMFISHTPPSCRHTSRSLVTWPSSHLIWLPRSSGLVLAASKRHCPHFAVRSRPDADRIMSPRHSLTLGLHANKAVISSGSRLFPNRRRHAAERSNCPIFPKLNSVSSMSVWLSPVTAYSKTLRCQYISGDANHASFLGFLNWASCFMGIWYLEKSATKSLSDA